MSLVAKWERIRSELPKSWTDARLAFRPVDEAGSERAATLLAPLMPGHVGKELRFFAARRDAGAAPAAVVRAFEQLDAEGIGGELRLLGAGERPEEPAPAGRPGLAAAFDVALSALPPDWSDLYAELELSSSDDLEPAAIALAPVNPARYGGTPGVRFRVARRFGYGASPGMTRRCLTRLDERGVRGELRLLRALSGTRPVATQGPVWHVDGKVV